MGQADTDHIGVIFVSVAIINTQVRETFKGSVKMPDGTKVLMLCGRSPCMPRLTSPLIPMIG
jgi:hypothetical protein